jgi:hypothetical protein
MGIATAELNVVERVHRIAVQRDPHELAAELQALLGQKLVAFAVGDRHPKSIGRYARGERAPEEPTGTRLAELYMVVLILQEEKEAPPSWIKRWMLGTNPHLGGKAPAQVFHDGDVRRVIGAARSFVSGR